MSKVVFENCFIPDECAPKYIVARTIGVEISKLLRAHSLCVAIQGTSESIRSDMSMSIVGF